MSWWWWNNGGGMEMGCEVGGVSGDSPSKPANGGIDGKPAISDSPSKPAIGGSPSLEVKQWYEAGEGRRKSLG